jgi:hypothetical protein
MKTTKAAFMISLILVSAYAEEYDKKTQAAPSAPTEHYVATVHIDGNASTQATQIIRQRRSLLRSCLRAEGSH